MLFTLEKLIYKVVKQLQLLTQDDLTHALHSLYRYEQSRAGPPEDGTYFANAHVLMHDDTCFRFANLPGDKATIQMMDPDKSEVPAGDACSAYLLGGQSEAAHCVILVIIRYRPCFQSTLCYFSNGWGRLHKQRLCLAGNHNLFLSDVRRHDGAQVCGILEGLRVTQRRAC